MHKQQFVITISVALLALATVFVSCAQGSRWTSVANAQNASDLFELASFGISLSPDGSLLVGMSRDFGKTIGQKIRISQSDDASASCSGSSQLDPPSASSACTVRSTTPSTFNATSSPDPPCGSSEPKRRQCGKMRSQRNDSWRALALNTCSIQLP